MARTQESPGTRLRALWTRLSRLPGGRWIFSKILGWMVPYTGKLGATILTLEPGHVKARLHERKAVRNHLRSIHAIALANLGELTTGLALVGALPKSIRGILVGLEISYTKKARGTIESEATCEIPEITEPVDYPVEAEIRDDSGDVVARVRAHWRLGPALDKQAPR
ncbi:MAG TPA: DUF4442 domain-containing protein [Gemmatimonadetes bacterium]|nr:DUF4442 domain-containing protein [Gemmatimonadota bacterium]HIA73306.1 DUF4442 domain-containing protein [Gemmatimonadota bacterium]HIB09083.1 DUF4442 domain-containing protein [Gemmatimonadota bacterium]HIC16349.1 DUF4442 domain-containing protein [Gemmatimonadota bacterium]HIN78131.1 DUF4442 domain-containing protein [Gemmatimonadota bacterium]